MKILAISGSLRNGNTRYLVDETVNTLKNITNVQIEKIYLSNIKMRFCNGCLSCDETGKCVFDDDMTDIVLKAKSADAFILATPARWGLLSGEMKTFLDRLNPLAVNEELKGKKAIVFSVGQSDEDDSESILLAAKSLVTFCENAGIKVVETVSVCGCYYKDDVSKKKDYINACKCAGSNLIKSIKCIEHV